MPRAEWLLLALLLFCFLPALFGMAAVWASVDFYSHGFLVPLVALWAANQERQLHLQRKVVRDARGAWIVASATVLLGAGLALDIVTLQGLAFVAALCGVVNYAWGPRGLRGLAFPLAFLLFMVPLPDAWLGPIIVDLQLLVSSTSVALLDGVGIEVAREGNVLRLPGGETLFVDEACSGITSIVTLVPLAVMLAYFTERSGLRRAALVAAVIPAAMLANLLRVIATVVAADAFGVQRATESLWHEAAGLLTFVLACLALIGLGPLMRRLHRPRPA